MRRLWSLLRRSSYEAIYLRSAFMKDIQQDDQVIANRVRLLQNEVDALRANRIEKMATSIFAAMHGNPAFAETDPKYMASDAVNAAEILVAEIARRR
jgi:hypothetical protein